MALDRRDRRQWAVHRQLKDFLVGELRLPILDREQGLEGAAGGEIIVVAGDDHRAAVGRGGRVGEGLLQALD